MRQIFIAFILFCCFCVIIISGIVKRKYDHGKKEKYLQICRRLNFVSFAGIAGVLLGSVMLLTDKPTWINLAITMFAGLLAMGSFAVSAEIQNLMKQGR